VDRSVYRLTQKVDNENVILKVLQNNDKLKQNNAEREAWGNHNVGQLLGWAQTPNKALSYLFIKNMGVPSSETGLDKQQLTQLRKEARKLYKSTYHLKHA
jgi:hypothetical protein